MENRSVDQIIQEEAKPPFREEFVDAGFDDREKLLSFAQDPEKILRINATEAGESLETLRNDVRVGKALLEEFRDAYEIRMPNFEFVIGYDEKKRPRVYTLTERIHGANLLETYFFDEEKEEAVEELELFLASLIRYAQDIYKNPRRPFITDQLADPGQYVWGYKKNDQKKHIYLVDLDYYPHGNLLEQGEENYYKGFFFTIGDLFCLIEEMEEKLSATLPAARRKFKELVTSINPSDPHFAIVFELVEEFKSGN